MGDDHWRRAGQTRRHHGRHEASAPGAIHRARGAVRRSQRPVPVWQRSQVQEVLPTSIGSGRSCSDPTRCSVRKTAKPESEPDVQELLRRVGGEAEEVRRRARSGEYRPGLTETTLETIGYQRVFAALGISPKHCLWCLHTAQGSSTTVEVLGGVIQSCQRGTCRSAGRNHRPLARIVSKCLFNEDDWRSRESAIRMWIAKTFHIELPELLEEISLCCF